MNLKTLSERLSLSQTTVSRALNGYSDVSDATRQRVIAAAEKYNYRPSYHASRLAAGKSKSIAHIIPHGKQSIIDPHFSDFISGAAQVYGEYGYELCLSVVADKEEKNTYHDYIKGRKVDGFVLQAPMTDDWRISLLDEGDVPFVVHGRSDSQAVDYSFMDVNNAYACQRATSYLLELGHRRIALLNGLETMNFAKRRRQGFEKAMAEYDCVVPENYYFSDNMTEPYGYQACKNLLALPVSQRPSALLITSMLPAIGAFRALNEAGLTMPDDLSIVAYDDKLSFLQGGQSDIPLFTSVRSSIFDAGKQVAEQLIAQINTQPQSPIQTLWEAEFVLGRSTKPYVGD